MAQTSTAGYYWMSRRLAEYAEILGYDRRLSEHYGALAERIRERFNREFLDPGPASMRRIRRRHRTRKNTPPGTMGL